MLRTCVPTGVDGLDRLIGGLTEGELVIVAGRPSTGKTALLAMVARGLMRQRAGEVFVYSPEMTAEKMKRRIGKSERVVVTDGQSVGLDEFCGLVREHGGRGELSAAAIDQTELVGGDEAGCWKVLRALGEETGVPVLATAALRRFAGRPPVLADLAGGDGVADAADTLLLLHRLRPLEKSVEIILAKHPSGRTGVARFELGA